jgi:hypothetical protein
MAALVAPPPQQGAGAILPSLYTALHGMSLTNQNGGDSGWFMDTGASSHMASHPGMLHTHSTSTVPRQIIVGNCDLMSSSSIGHTLIPTTSSSPLKLNNILIAPQLVKNLISVRSLTRDNNVSVEFDPWGFSIKDLRTRMTLLRCDSSGELYPLRHAPGTTSGSSAQALLTKTDEPLWHSRFGHPGHDALQHLSRLAGFSCSPSSRHTCHACRLGKHVRLPFSESTHISSFPFQLLHCDVWTSPIMSNSGYKFYLVILDDFSHYVWTFPLRHKSDVLPTLISFHAFVGTQFQCAIQCFQTDNGREFDNSASRAFYAKHGIVLRLTCPYTS